MRAEDGTYEYEVGQKIGLLDLVEQDSEDYIVWYELLAIEQDDELPIAWFYLKSETDKLNDKDSEHGKYAELIESISDRIVVED